MLKRLAPVPPAPIQMIDNDEGGHVPGAGPDETAGRPVIKGVRVVRWTEMPGSGPMFPPYVVWTMEVTLALGVVLVVHKRYSEFVALRAQLVQEFPPVVTYAVGPESGRKQRQRYSSIPPLTTSTKRDLWWKFGAGSADAQREFLEHERRPRLEVFASFVFLDPTLSKSAAVRQFVGSGGNGVVAGRV